MLGVQEKVLAQVQASPKPKKAAAKPKAAAAKGAKGAKAAKEEVEEEVDPVQEALSKYGIIMSNPWKKEEKCATPDPHASGACALFDTCYDP